MFRALDEFAGQPRFLLILTARLVSAVPSCRLIFSVTEDIFNTDEGYFIYEFDFSR